jgi:hypothetical protein
MIPSHGPKTAAADPEVVNSTSPAAAGISAGRSEKFAATTSEPTR